MIDFFLHLDQHLTELTHDYGPWTYLILFVIVFCETGLVVTPFLPGDSLLFAAGAVAALRADDGSRPLNVWLLGALLMVAAVLGDTVNYHFGRFCGPQVLRSQRSWLFNKKHLQRTHDFFERYGGKTIVIARFVPIVRTFAPFVAGVGSMSYARFLAYNVVGGVLWVTLFVAAGYVFGNVPLVRDNFTLVILVIVFLSILPGVIEFLRARRSHAKAARSLTTAGGMSSRGYAEYADGMESAESIAAADGEKLPVAGDLEAS